MLKKMVFGFVIASCSLSGASSMELLVEGPEIDLTTEDMDRAIKSVPAQQIKNALSDEGKILGYIDSMYLTLVAAQRARQVGLDGREDIQARLWKEEVNILAEAYFSEYVGLDEAALSDAAREYYMSNHMEFMKPQTYAAAHLMISDTSDAGRKQLEGIKQKLENSELSFEEAVKLYSEDQRTLDEGGKIGLFTEKMVVSEFFNAVKAADEGELIGPVETQFGLHLIRVGERTAEQLIDFEEVKPKIMEQLRQDFQTKKKENLIRALRTEDGITVNRKAIDNYVQELRARNH